VSPLPSGVVLDNTMISTLYLAGALSRVLGLWPGQWVVPLQVRDEAGAWKLHGAEVVTVLNDLQARGVIDYATPDPGPEGALFAQLQRTRGQGESAAIAIAYRRGFAVATDDRQARVSCQGLAPPVRVLATEALLKVAVDDSPLTPAEAQPIWRATGIRDPTRWIGR
jgi:predicted nucleic acid-binding protein